MTAHSRVLHLKKIYDMVIEVLEIMETIGILHG